MTPACAARVAVSDIDRGVPATLRRAPNRASRRRRHSRPRLRPPAAGTSPARPARPRRPPGQGVLPVKGAKAKPLTRAQKLARALRACRKQDKAEAGGVRFPGPPEVRHRRGAQPARGASDDRAARPPLAMAALLRRDSRRPARIARGGAPGLRRGALVATLLTLGSHLPRVWQRSRDRRGGKQSRRRQRRRAVRPRSASRTLCRQVSRRRLSPARRRSRRKRRKPT